MTLLPVVVNDESAIYSSRPTKVPYTCPDGRNASQSPIFLTCPPRANFLYILSLLINLCIVGKSQTLRIVPETLPSQTPYPLRSCSPFLIPNVVLVEMPSTKHPQNMRTQSAGDRPARKSKQMNELPTVSQRMQILAFRAHTK